MAKLQTSAGQYFKYFGNIAIFHLTIYRIEEFLISKYRISILIIRIYHHYVC